MAHQLPTFADLRKQMHEDLRVQNPEWVHANGESPLCDSYEARLMETLRTLNQTQHSSSSVRIAMPGSNDRFEKL